MATKEFVDIPIEAAGEPEGHGHNQTVKSTFIMGGASIVNIILGIVRHKLIALLLNPAGFGLLGVFQSISQLATTITGMGINESGARQIAVAFRAGNKALVARTALSLRLIALVAGCLGAVVLALSGRWISLLTFRDSMHALEISILSLTILLGAISGAQLALIQGARRIPDLAKVNMLGPLWGTLLSLPVIYFLGSRGIVSYLIAMSAANVIASWWYYRKIDLPPVGSSWRGSLLGSMPLLGLGAAFMVGSILDVSTTYVLRILLVRNLGLDEAGQFQAAYTISFVYVGILFKAMATDFYPRLSAASMNNREVKSLVNGQIEVGLLLAVPGVLATLALAPLIMVAFYSPKFLPGVVVLRWQALGILLQIISWPLGYILRAKADSILFVLTESLNCLFHILLAWLAIRAFGLPGIGMAFFLANALYFVLIYSVASIRHKVTFTPEIIRVIVAAIAITMTAFLCSYMIPGYSLTINVALSISAGVYSYKKLSLSEWIGRFFKSIKPKE